MERAAQKRKIDALFLAHAIFAVAAGSVAFVVSDSTTRPSSFSLDTVRTLDSATVQTPHVFEWFMVHHGEKLTLRGNGDDESKVTHLVIRIYGALILAQAWMTWSARKCDAQIRRAMIQVRSLRDDA